MTEQYSNGLLEYFKDPYADCCDIENPLITAELFKRMITIADTMQFDHIEIENMRVAIDKHFELKHRLCAHKKVSAFTYLKIHLSHLFG